MGKFKQSVEEIEKEKKEIEEDSFLSELDNGVSEDGEPLDNEVGSDEEYMPEDDQSGDFEEDDLEGDINEKEDDGTDMKVEGDSLVSKDGSVSVDIDSELNKAGTDDMTGMQETEEEKDAATSASIFGMNTGASKVQEGLEGDSAGLALSEAKSDTEDPLELGDKTGATKTLGKKKRFLFKAIMGLKKAKKGIGNFFKKKLPAAFKTGAKATLDAIRKTPLSPIATVVDKISEYRERTRPQRELKAERKKEEKRRKKEKWLLDKDEKRKAKEEAARIKKERKELEAKIKAQLELENGPNMAKVFFKTIWKGIKTGAKWIWKKIKNSKLALVGKFAAKAIKPVKRLVAIAKDRIVDLISDVSAEIEQMKDEYDAFSFEERMQKITEEENKKRANGEEVPEEDYRTRYLNLTEELKVKLASIRDNIGRREEIEKELAEMEGHKAPDPDLEDKDNAGKDILEQIRNEAEWQAVGSVTRGSDISTTVFNAVGQTNWVTGFVKKAVVGVGIVRLVSSVGKACSQAARLSKYKDRKDLMEAINATSNDALIQRVSKYAQSNAELQEMEAGFNIALNGLNIGRGIGELTGMTPLATGFKVAGWITTGVKILATASKKRSGVKAGIKDMLGGPEGYYGLKKKYKMHAPEMRRAVRDALGVATSEDAVTADKWELSHLMNERVKSGDTDANLQRMIVEAGGSSEKRFDALQGAGTKVRHRNVNRRRRMIA